MRFSGLLAILALALLTNDASAQALKTNLRTYELPKQKAKPLVAGPYLVTIACDTKNKRNVRDIRTSVQSQSDRFPFGTVTTLLTASHYVVLSRGVPGSSAAAGIPTEGIAYIMTYTARDHEPVINLIPFCRRTLIHNGADPLYLWTAHSESTEQKPDQLRQIFGSLSRLISPIWSLFGPVPAIVGTAVAAVTAVQKEVDDSVAKLNSGARNYPAQPRQLGEGSYFVENDYLTMRIDIRRTPSVVNLNHPEHPSIIRAFRTFVTTLDAGKDDRCAYVYRELSALGYSKRDDIPFALTWSGATKLTKAQLIACLGRDSALAALALSNSLLWDHLHKDIHFTREEVIAATSPGPASHGDVGDRLDRLNVAHLAYSAAPSDTTFAAIASLMNPSAFKLEDRTRSQVVASIREKLTKDGKAAGETDVLRELLRMYGQSGCYQAPKENMGKQLNYNSLILLFEGRSNTVAMDQVRVLFLTFDADRKLVSVLLHDNPSFVRAHLENENKCYHINVVQKVAAN